MGAKKLTEDEEALYGEAHGLLSTLVDDLEDQKHPTREFSLAYTKLEEAEMWMQRGFERLGYEPIEDGAAEGEEDGGDDGGDDGEEDDDEEEPRPKDEEE